MSNTKSLIKWYKYGKLLMSYGFLFWLAETAFFIISYGWHLRAANQIEHLCDQVAWWAIAIGFCMRIGAVFAALENHIDLLLEEEKEWKRQSNLFENNHQEE